MLQRHGVEYLIVGGVAAIDPIFLNAIEISTWRTDAGDLDVLVDIPGRDGARQQYEDLAARAQTLDCGGVARPGRRTR